MTPHRSGLEPAPLLNILTGLLLAKLSMPSSLAKYLITVLPVPITAKIIYKILQMKLLTTQKYKLVKKSIYYIDCAIDDPC